MLTIKRNKTSKKNKPTKLNKTIKKKTRVNKKNILSNQDTIVFYDDDYSGNINPFRATYPYMKSILVPSNKPYYQILKGNKDFYYPMMFLKKYKDNKYAQCLVKGMVLKKSSNLCNECQNITGQGITIKEIQKIIKWANHKNNLDTPRLILFDWDQTISVCNGIFLPDNIDNIDDKHNVHNYSNKFTFTEMAHYFAGTLERFNALQFMFFNLRKNGVKCQIFTNNGWGKKRENLKEGEEDKNLNFFLSIVQVLDPQMKESDIIYGNGDKVNTFRKSKSLSSLYRLSLNN